MRLGEWDLQLVRREGEAFPEVTTSDGRKFVVASPGESFGVRVTRRNTDYKPKSDILYRVNVSVDGTDVGYGKLFTTQNTGVFEGFLDHGDAHSSTYRSFVFSKPVETTAKQVTSLKFDEGSIKCKVYRGRFTGGKYAAGSYRGSAQTNSSISKLPEGKKFFMAPSLTTAKGEVKHGNGFNTRAIELLDGGEPVAVVELRYETATTLLLRGILKRDNPVHHAILQQFPETAEQEEGAAEGAGSFRTAGAALKRAHWQEQELDAQHRQQQRDAAGARVKQEETGPRVKRQAKEEVVDLTKGFNENDEVLAARKANKLLECDLTADEEPAWRAVKKEVHHV